MVVNGLQPAGRKQPVTFAVNEVVCYSLPTTLFTNFDASASAARAASRDFDEQALGMRGSASLVEGRPAGAAIALVALYPFHTRDLKPEQNRSKAGAKPEQNRFRSEEN